MKSRRAFSHLETKMKRSTKSKKEQAPLPLFQAPEPSTQHGTASDAEITRVGPLVEVGSGSTWQYLCPVCCIPEVFRGYRQDQARALVLPKHIRCAQVIKPAPAPSATSPSDQAPAKTWSSYQETIFQDAAEGTGHTAVLARAGTGKTTTIVEAVRRMPPGRKLVLAFNSSIREELQRRMPEGVDVMTLHSLGAKAIRQAFPSSRVDQKKIAGILTREAFFPDKKDHERRSVIARMASMARATLLDPRQDTEALMTRARVDLNPFLDMDVEDAPQRALRVVGDITADVLRVAREEAHVSHDFDEMLWLPHQLGLPLGQWDRVVVDEAQDLSSVQIELLQRAVAPGGRVLVVGDDRQAIYSWRGADTAAFSRLVSSLDAKVLPLTVTYRCPRTVVDLAREEVPDLEAAPNAPLGSVQRTTSLQVQHLRPGDMVLSRKNAPLLGLFFRCVGAGVPAALQGRDGLLRELKDLVTSAMDAAGAGATGEDVLAAARERIERAIWLRKEREQDCEDLLDKLACLEILFEKCADVGAVLEEIASLDRRGDDKDERLVCLSSIHRAKGMERERVWVLAFTLNRRISGEEANLWYVAVTRAKSELILVEKS
jgi:DNA helicase-2/ATP-dependent DNA helicase PcrA